jgi:hypothetical protein
MLHVSLWGPFEDIPLPVHARLVGVNLLKRSTGRTPSSPHFLARGGTGVIVNVVSISGGTVIAAPSSNCRFSSR